jgi:hypothetical protein
MYRVGLAALFGLRLNVKGLRFKKATNGTNVHELSSSVEWVWVDGVIALVLSKAKELAVLLDGVAISRYANLNVEVCWLV